MKEPLLDINNGYRALGGGSQKEIFSVPAFQSTAGALLNWRSCVAQVSVGRSDADKVKSYILVFLAF